MKARILLLAAFFTFATAVAAFAQSLPSAKPEQVGLSSERLQRLMDVIKADVDKRVIPGAVVVVARHGKVAFFETAGARDPATKMPMTMDTIFRIYSMSKPIASVAPMVLWEDGKFNLSKPVSKYIPQMGECSSCS